MVSSTCTVSAKLHVKTPFTDRSGQPGGSAPPTGIRPVDGLKPCRPHTDAGMRIDPPPSEAVARGTNPAATAAALPPDDPPAENSLFHGLVVPPNSVLCVSPFHPYSGVLVLPTTMHPAARSRSTKIESLVAGASSACNTEPWVVTKPCASSRSFTPIGTPANGASTSPRARDASTASASTSARSSATETKACTLASELTCSRAYVTTSRADVSPEAINAAVPEGPNVRKSMCRP